MGNQDGANKVLKKHTAAIHCSNTLSLFQRKISNALLYHAYHELPFKEEHAITIKELCHLIGYSGHNYDAIKDALRGLIITLLEWNLIDDDTGEEDWSATSILASVRMKGPHCLYAYSPRLRQLFFSPSVYGKINLIMQSRFKSSYGLALYENCARYRGLPSTKWFEIGLFRKLMGIPEEMYPIFRDFKRRVLDKAIEEVNTYSDVYIEAEIDRAGRKVVRLRFNLKERPKKARIGAMPEQPDAGLDKEQTRRVKNEQTILMQRLIREFNFTQTLAQEIVTNFAIDYIEQKITYILSSKNFQLGKINNVSGFLLTSIREDYQAPVNVENIKAQQNQLGQIEQNKLLQQERAQQSLRKEYDSLLARDFIARFNQFDEQLQAYSLHQWLEQIKQQAPKRYRLVKQFYEKYGIDHPVIYTELHVYLQQIYPDKFPQPQSFEQYCEGRPYNKYLHLLVDKRE